MFLSILDLPAHLLPCPQGYHATLPERVGLGYLPWLTCKGHGSLVPREAIEVRAMMATKTCKPANRDVVMSSVGPPSVMDRLVLPHLHPHPCRTSLHGALQAQQAPGETKANANEDATYQILYHGPVQCFLRLEDLAVELDGGVSRKNPSAPLNTRVAGDERRSVGTGFVILDDHDPRQRRRDTLPPFRSWCARNASLFVVAEHNLRYSVLGVS